jgi:hypothetical protein
MLHWYNLIEAISYELGASGIVDFELGDLLLHHRNAFSYESIQKIAETLLKIKHKMELKAYKALTLTKPEIDRMTSAEMANRIKEDPEFEKQFNLLANFKQLS